MNTMLLYSYMKEVASGCIPWRRMKNGTVEVLMILRTGGYWEFPKGKQEKGETDGDTALRELKEETNLKGNLSTEHPISLRYTFTRNGVNVEKQVMFFMCEIDLKSKVSIERKEVTDYIWLPTEDIEQKAMSFTVRRVQFTPFCLFS
ncbi:MAG: NUDIX hydrolase [Parcubacteria group bacterium GW2011_GWA2_43_11]|nr:MAG: NUDIX hydrolase [Parcubacteria group bacterium GW2011_GWA2_43_11]